jgi:hypothetical protein
VATLRSGEVGRALLDHGGEQLHAGTHGEG